MLIRHIPAGAGRQRRWPWWLYLLGREYPCSRGGTGHEPGRASWPMDGVSLLARLGSPAGFDQPAFDWFHVVEVTVLQCRASCLGDPHGRGVSFVRPVACCGPLRGVLLANVRVPCRRSGRRLSGRRAGVLGGRGVGSCPTSIRRAGFCPRSVRAFPTGGRGCVAPLPGVWVLQVVLVPACWWSCFRSPLIVSLLALDERLVSVGICTNLRSIPAVAGWWLGQQRGNTHQPCSVWCIPAGAGLTGRFAGRNLHQSSAGVSQRWVGQ